MLSRTTFARLTIGVALVLTTPSVFAKDMAHRLGFGYSDSFSVSPMPSLAAKFYPSTDIAFSAALGIDSNTTNTSGGPSNFGLGVKFYKTVFSESMLNFYIGGGAALLTQSPATGSGASSSGGFELDGFAGAEFFIPGLDNLGFNFQAGAGITSLASSVRFRTIGDSPLKAGIYFYF